jgi:large subunit ribosomal protein L9
MGVNMKVILLQDVKSLGKKGEIVEVSDGYARNFVLPKKLGAEANSKNMNDLKLQKANADKIAKEQLEAAQELAKVLETKEVIVKMKSGEGGKAFGSISSKEIAEEAKKQCELELDKKKIQLPEAIKSLGVYEVNVKLHTKVMGKLKVKVIEE